MVGLRYGQTLEEATEKMQAGTWLCPHCYEEENPDDGWICNSSICMKRRGLKPTGIAIYDAQQRGFKSVAHLLQVRRVCMTGLHDGAGGNVARLGSSRWSSKPVWLLKCASQIPVR